MSAIAVPTASLGASAGIRVHPLCLFLALAAALRAARASGSPAQFTTPTISVEAHAHQ